MTRVLLVQTAAAARVRRKAEEILAGSEYPDPEITVLCTGDNRTVGFFSELPHVKVVGMPRRRAIAILRELRGRAFDIQHAFWTGERRYRRLKVACLLTGSKETRVHTGDGGVFRLTWKAIVRHCVFRWQHPLPTDHYEFVPPISSPGREGDHVLLLQSAEPHYVLNALQRLGGERPIFRAPKCTVFCRNSPEFVTQFAAHPLVASVLTHTETRGTWQHLRRLRRERYDAVVLFFTGDPSYWKIKYFGFLIGARHKLIFNENNDCFFFTMSNWLTLMSRRLAQRSRLGGPSYWSWAHRLRALGLLTTKLFLLPLRFVWLLLVWLRLRSSARRA